jgi:hypothetical protein
MLKWIIRRRLAAFEKTFGYDMGYARELLDIDTRALLAYAKIDAMGSYRKDLPATPYFAAKLVGVMAEDCGPCVQLGVTLALREKVAPAVISAVLRGDDAAMPDDVRLAVQFARASLAHSPDADDLRDAIVAKWGKRALVSIAFALTSARVYPTVKYALGFGKTCQRVEVAGTIVPVARAA